MEQQTIGKRIAQLRKEKGLTQEQLAETLGVTPQAVSKWENDASCPDISIIAKLSDVLGVSTDELLGAKPMEPRVVVVNSQSSGEQKSRKEPFSWSFDVVKQDSIFFAIAVILLGVAFLLERLGVLSIGIWGMVWPALLIGLGVSWCVKRFSFVGLGVALLGLYYLLFNLGATEFVLRWSHVWPILIILFGLTILLEKVRPHRIKVDGHNCAEGKGSTEYSNADGYIHYDSSFTEDSQRFEGETFMGGSIDVSFGKFVLDLTGMTHVAPNARLSADVSFGDLEVVLPRFVRLRNDTDKAFGSVQIRGEANADASELLIVASDVSFGNMLIRYQ